jgi:4-aminobutyrate aminotransferase / (S)-3-amino-2-methylpropionate transaminase / 5-aminovalerate transaminase
VEMVSDRGTKDPDAPFVGRLMAETQRKGLITVACGMYHNVLRHMSPLVITDDQLDEAMDVLADAALAARST